MVQRAEVLEKFMGRRAVSCLGMALLFGMLFAAGLLIWSLFFQKTKMPERNSAQEAAGSERR